MSIFHPVIAFLRYLVVLGLFTCHSCITTTPVNAEEKDNAHAVLRLELVGTPRRNQIEVKMILENKGTHIYTWDKHFCVLCDWHIFADGKRLEPERVVSASTLSKAHEERFVQVKPGETVNATVVLTECVPRFWHARKITTTPDGESVVLPVGGETWDRYTIPKDAGSVAITLAIHEYASDEADAFAVVYGIRPEELRMLNTDLKSNKVTLRFAH